MEPKEPPEPADGESTTSHQHWHYHGPADHHEHVHPDGFTGGHVHPHNHVEVSLGEFLLWLFGEAEQAAGNAPGAQAEAGAAGPERSVPNR